MIKNTDLNKLKEVFSLTVSIYDKPDNDGLYWIYDKPCISAIGWIDGKMKSFKINLPKKEIDYEWLYKRIENLSSNYKNLQKTNYLYKKDL